MNKPLVNTDGEKTAKDFMKKISDSAPLNSVIKKILKNKLPVYTEIEVSFFQLCDLHCSFCWQDSFNTDGVTTIKDKADTVIDYLKHNRESLMPLIQIHMLGGELFEDNNNYYTDYLYFIKKIKKYCDEYITDKKILFIFISNLNFKTQSTQQKIEALFASLKKLNCDYLLATSWDPTGRPMKGEVSSHFHKNIEYFKEDLAEITFVLTKPTIRRILKDKNDYLDYLYENFKIDVDYYTPTGESDKLMPSDWDLLNGLRYLINKYPKISKLQPFLDFKNKAGTLSCASLNKVTILPDGTITNCRHLDYNQKDFETKILNECNSDMIMNYITKKECLSCRHFEKCPMSCFLMSDSISYSSQSVLDECIYKTIYDEIESNKLPTKI